MVPLLHPRNPGVPAGSSFGVNTEGVSPELYFIARKVNPTATAKLDIGP